jgi:hypothetical protein
VGVDLLVLAAGLSGSLPANGSSHEAMGVPFASLSAISRNPLKLISLHHLDFARGNVCPV